MKNRINLPMTVSNVVTGKLFTYQIIRSDHEEICLHTATIKVCRPHHLNNYWEPIAWPHDNSSEGLSKLITAAIKEYEAL